jgi:hypothetical protein
MESEEQLKTLDDITALSKTYISDYEQRLARGVTSKEQELELLNDMFVQGLKTIRLQQELGIPASEKYKVQHLALLATIKHLQSEESQLPDAIDLSI